MAFNAQTGLRLTPPWEFTYRMIQRGGKFNILTILRNE